MRDPLKQPFASESIWNMPIGSGAVYVWARLSGFPHSSDPAALMPGTDPEHIVLTPSASLTDVLYSGAGWGGGDRCFYWPEGLPGEEGPFLLARVPIPAGYFVESSRTNSCAAFLGKDGRTVVQVQPLARCAGYGYATSRVTFDDVDLYGPGITGSHGGSGLSALGGSIRMGELCPGQIGPRHVLKINVYAKQFFYPGHATDDCRRWPALNCDNYADGWYGTEGGGGPHAMRMGALLAIPPTIDINALELETEPGRQLAWTLQNYGAYIVDDTYAPGFAIAVEDGANGSKAAEFQANYGYPMAQRVGALGPWGRDIQTLCGVLYVVDNNSPNSIGGGGTPRQPLAEPLADPRTPRLPSLNVTFGALTLVAQATAQARAAVGRTFAALTLSARQAAGPVNAAVDRVFDALTVTSTGKANQPPVPPPVGPARYDQFQIGADGRATITKDPQAMLDYTFDWSAYLALDGDRLADAHCSADAGTVAKTTVYAGTATAWLSGGTAGSTITLTCQIATAGGRFDACTAFIKIRDR